MQGGSMEAQQQIGVLIFLTFGIHSIIVFAGIGTNARAPSLSGKDYLIVDYHKNSEPNIITCFPCSQKYLLEYYFEKHESQLHSDFRHFLSHFSSLDSCDGLVDNLSSMFGRSILQRHLIGEGSHRHLTSCVKFDIQSNVIYEQAAHDCEAVLIEKLPLGVFADPFELQHLVQHGVFTNAAVFGDTNLELPSALSNRAFVEVHLNISHKLPSRCNREVDIAVEIPVHARYPHLDESGYSRVEIGSPDLLMRCRLENSQENCLWISIALGGKSMTNDIAVWKVPCGNRAHAEVVSAVTFASAVISALSIVLTTVFYSPHAHHIVKVHQ